MAIFNCDECGVIENSALSNYWMRNDEQYTPKEKLGKALCSQCDPEIGEWHGAFPRSFEKVEDLQKGS